MEREQIMVKNVVAIGPGGPCITTVKHDYSGRRERKELSQVNFVYF